MVNITQLPCILILVYIHILIRKTIIVYNIIFQCPVFTSNNYNNRFPDYILD